MYDQAIPSGTYNFTTITIPAGVRITTTGSGVVDLRATGDVVIGGILDLSGTSGGRGTTYCTNPGGSGGGNTGNLMFFPVDGVSCAGPSGCPGPAGYGGSGSVGGFGMSITGFNVSGLGGVFGGGGGGAGFDAAAGGGGGGGGFAGGGGGVGSRCGGRRPLRAVTAEAPAAVAGARCLRSSDVAVPQAFRTTTDWMAALAPTPARGPAAAEVRSAPTRRPICS